MEVNVQKTVKYIFSLVIAGVLVYYSFRGVAWSDFTEGLQQCTWWMLALSMLAGASAFGLRGLRWRRLIQPIAATATADATATAEPTATAEAAAKEPGRLDTYDAVTIGNVSNMIFPFLGDFVRCGIVAKNTRTRYDRVFGTVALERVLDLATIGLLFVILFAFKWEVFGTFFMENIWRPAIARFDWIVWLALGIVAVAGLAAVVAIFMVHDKYPALDKVYKAFAGLFQGFGSILKIKGWGFFVAETLLIWAMYWLQIVLLTHAFPAAVGMGIIDALFIMIVGSIASFVPVPNGVGAYHYLVALALSGLYPMGFTWATAIVFATIAHESQAITMVITGAISYVRQLVSRQ